MASVPPANNQLPLLFSDLTPLSSVEHASWKARGQDSLRTEAAHEQYGRGRELAIFGIKSQFEDHTRHEKAPASQKQKRERNEPLNNEWRNHADVLSQNGNP